MKLELVMDSITHTAGPETQDRSSSRHLLFRSKRWDLNLFISRNTTNIRVHGQVLPGSADDMQGVMDAIVLLSCQEDLVATTRVSSQGKFEFNSLPDADFKIELFLQASHLTASFRP